MTLTTSPQTFEAEKVAGLSRDRSVGAVRAKTGLLRSDDRGASWHRVAPDPAVLGLASTASGAVLAAGNDGVQIGPDWAR